MSANEVGSSSDGHMASRTQARKMRYAKRSLSELAAEEVKAMLEAQGPCRTAKIAAKVGTLATAMFAC